MMRGATVDVIKDSGNESGANINQGEDDLKLKNRRDGASENIWREQALPPRSKLLDEDRALRGYLRSPFQN